MLRRSSQLSLILNFDWQLLRLKKKPELCSSLDLLSQQSVFLQGPASSAVSKRWPRTSWKGSSPFQTIEVIDRRSSRPIAGLPESWWITGWEQTKTTNLTAAASFKLVALKRAQASDRIWRKATRKANPQDAHPNLVALSILLEARLKASSLTAKMPSPLRFSLAGLQRRKFTISKNMSSASYKRKTFWLVLWRNSTSMSNPALTMICTLRPNLRKWNTLSQRPLLPAESLRISANSSNKLHKKKLSSTKSR